MICVSKVRIFVFVKKEWKADQVIIIHLEELLGVDLALFVPANDDSRRHFPLAKKA